MPPAHSHSGISLNHVCSSASSVVHSIISDPNVRKVSEVIEHVLGILEFIMGNALQYDLAILRAGEVSAAEVDRTLSKGYGKVRRE